MEPLLRWLWRTGLRRGMSGEGWPWLLLAGAAFAVRRARREGPETIAKVRVHPGDRFEIVTTERAHRRRSAASEETRRVPRDGGRQT